MSVRSKSPKTKSTKSKTITTKSTREHVLERPDMYIGPTSTTSEKCFVVKDDKFVLKRMDVNNGIDHIINEIIDNAIDNQEDSAKNDIEMTEIRITADKETGRITVFNDGLWIPVIEEEQEIEDEWDSSIVRKHKTYKPEFCFTHPRTGGNFDDTVTRRKSGRNGIGSKATNIFSKEFTFVCIDPEQKLRYEQTCRNNLTIKEKANITKTKQKTGSTEISFIPDYERFGVKGLTDDMIALLEKKAYDCAMSTGLNVYFNGAKIPRAKVKNFESYINLYFDEKPNTIGFESEDCQVFLTEQSRSSAMKTGFQQISFVNGKYTKNGGTHVTAWLKAILTPIQKTLNGTTTKSKTKTKSTTKVTLEQLKKYFFIFVKCNLDKPSFDSQQKHCLTSDEKRINITKPTDTQLNKIMKWDFVQYIKEENKIDLPKLAKLKKNSVLGEEAVDANWAKSKEDSKRMKCMLFLTEGDSAATVGAIGRKVVQEGYNRIGTLALRGKVANATGAHSEKALTNGKLSLMRRMIGLENGVDYSDKENCRQLRYGKIVILTDADTDGYHIRGLLLNYFRVHFRGLFANKVVCVLNTPCVEVGKETFYSHHAYKLWAETHTKATKPTYYKGLGTHSDESAAAFFIANKNVRYTITDSCDEYMDNGLNASTATRKFSDKRKDMIWEFNPDAVELDENDEIVDHELVEGTHTLTEFIKHQFILFQLDATGRALPDIMDGQKEGQRKILHTAFTSNLKDQIKGLAFSGKVIETSLYHHGGSSLEGTIIKMCQGFVGARNIPLLYSASQHGSRLGGGKDAPSIRYVTVGMGILTKLLFMKEDLPFVTYKVDEGVSIEPQHYYPILPMILINGMGGMGSGFATKMPNYNPLDLIEYIKIFVKTKESNVKFKRVTLNPWWKGFKGEVEVDEVKGVQIVTTKGILTKEKGHKWVISELPIGMWTTKFKAYLETNFLKDGHITNIEEYNNKSDVKFVITAHKDFEPNAETNMKKLISKTKISNLFALVNGIPKKFENVYEIMDYWCEERYKIYGKRKVHQLEKLKAEKLKNQIKAQFIVDFNEEKIVLYKRSKKDVLDDMKKMYKPDPMGSDKPYGYLLDMPMSSLTLEKVKKLNELVESISKQISEVESKSLGEMWVNDLDNFKKEYLKFLKKY